MRKESMSEWNEVPCKCNYTPTAHPDEWKVDYINVGTNMITGESIGKMKVLKCKTCNDTSIISREKA